MLPTKKRCPRCGRVLPAEAFNLVRGGRDFKMKNVRELETYGAILIGCGIMAYTLMLASVDAPVWATIEFVMGTLFMVVGVWCVYLAGMEYDYQMEKRRYRNKR